MVRELTLEQIKDVFFAGMARGWINGGQAVRIPNFPGFKMIPVALGNFLLVDGFADSPAGSNKSSGMTVISYLGTPVWTMSYGGWYKEEAIPFLKRCLARAYVGERRFYGGRGPETAEDEEEGLIYVNKVELAAFDDFCGEEEVFDYSREHLGFHWYRGMSLLATS